MATDPQSLATQGSCYSCVGASIYEIFKLTLLAQIVLASTPSADVTPQGLINQAACFECASYVTLPQLMELALIKLIVQGGVAPPTPGLDSIILAESGDRITDESGNALITE